MKSNYKEVFLMYYSDRIIRDLEGRGNPFSYGSDVEEKIGFILDNYHELMEVYRSIKKQETEIDETREEAHRKLQNLRANEARWKRTKNYPKKFDADEHQARKAYYENLREAEASITYNGQPIGCDKLTFYILKHERMFKILDKFDLRVRGKLGFIASKTLEKALWAGIKCFDYGAKHSDNVKAEKFLKGKSKWMKGLPKWVNNKLTNP